MQERISLSPGWPLLVQPRAERAVEACEAAIHDVAEKRLHREGALLLRGFEVHGERGFQRFARSFGHELLSYDFGSTPRSKLEAGVYTSTEYPPHQAIPLHNEQSYTLQWPMKIWFHCMQAAPVGGQTPIADSREIHRRIDAAVRERWARRGLLYVRNYGGGLDLPWQRAFNTDDRAEVERYCRAQRIGYEWKADGELRTRQVCPAVMRHPVTGEAVWFNQAHLFHVSTLAPAVREALLAVVGDEAALPRNVYRGDGSPIDDTLLDEVRAVLDACAVRFDWQPGDVLMLDNMLVAHGRSTFEGARKVIVAMAEPAHA